MPNLKELKARIGSTEATKKITSAMKMIAAVRFNHSRVGFEKVSPYAEAIKEILNRANRSVEADNLPKLMSGDITNENHLLIVVASDKGLAGGYNSGVIKFAKETINNLISSGKNIQVITIGAKVTDYFNRYMKQYIINFPPLSIGKTEVDKDAVHNLASFIKDRFFLGEIGSCSFVYSDFKNAMLQVPLERSLIPLEGQDNNDSVFSYNIFFEPKVEKLIADLLEKNFETQIAYILASALTSEYAARMTAMDGATRNAEKMISSLKLYYNRTRQAYITKELIEVVSASEAMGKSA